MIITRREFLRFSSLAFMASLYPFNIEVLHNSEPGIPVLLYHEIENKPDDEYFISPSQFASQMEWLYWNGYRTLFFHEAEEVLKNRAIEGKENYIILTFDDGSITFLDYAFPLLEEYKFKATMNIIGEFAESKRSTLSWDECRFLMKSNLVEIGCHTFNLHSPLIYEYSSDEIRKDLIKFKKTLNRELGKDTQVLSFPFSKYDSRLIYIARSLGFKYLLTSEEGYLRDFETLSYIPRIHVNSKLDLDLFLKYLGANKL